MKNMLMRFCILCLGFPAIVFGQPAKPEGSIVSSDHSSFPLRRVVLFTNGTAYFEREATVTGSGTLEMGVYTRDVDDLLKSLVLIDSEGGTIQAVQYGSQDPLERSLKSFSLDLSGSSDLVSLLNQARGESVELWAGERIAGTLFGIEARDTVANTSISDQSGDDSQILTRIYINLLTEEGLRSIPYDSISRFSFQNPVLTEELKKALSLIAEGRNKDRKTINIRYAGSGTRKVRAGYVLESPVWKTVFRLVLGEGNRHLLQGWAIVENPTDDDWQAVRLDLISGMPLSYAMKLYEPLYNPRPQVPYTVERQMPSPVYSGGVASKTPATAPSSSRSQAITKGRLPDAFMDKSLAFSEEEEEESFTAESMKEESARAETMEAGEFIRYSIKDPVSLPRHEASLLPILNTEVEGERISIYNETINRKRPLNGVRLTNTTGFSLMGGPITVYEAGIYAGDARIDTISAGEKRLLSYSMDLDREILFLDKNLPETITRIQIRKGTLFVSKVVRKERTYTLVNRGNASRKVLLEHPVAAGYKLVEPGNYLERTETLYRFLVEAPAKKPEGTTFKVVEELPLDSTVALTNLQTETILFYQNQRTASPRLKDALAKIVSLKNEAAQATQARQDMEARINQITREQERIRKNMEVLDQTSALYQRYLKTLNEQEDTLSELQESLTKARALESQKKRDVEEYISNLEVD
jgi:hypothetical protein